MHISDLEILEVADTDDVSGGLTIDSPFFVPNFIQNPVPRPLLSGTFDFQLRFANLFSSSDS